MTGEDWYGADAVEAIVSDTGERLRIVTADGDLYLDGPKVLHERAAGRDWRVTGSGFWQVHPGAADTLVAAVLEALEPAPGERAADLYSGVGLFSAALAERVGPTGWVTGVEGDEVAVGDAARNLADLAQVESVVDRVDRALRRGALGERMDVVVLDPPRTGAKRDVVEGVAALRPARGGLRRLRPGVARPRRGDLRRARLRAAGAARVRPVPDDPPRRVRRAAAPAPPADRRRDAAGGAESRSPKSLDIVYLDVKRTSASVRRRPKLCHLTSEGRCPWARWAERVAETSRGDG